MSFILNVFCITDLLLSDMSKTLESQDPSTYHTKNIMRGEEKPFSFESLKEDDPMRPFAEFLNSNQKDFNNITYGYYNTRDFREINHKRNISEISIEETKQKELIDGLVHIASSNLDGEKHDWAIEIFKEDPKKGKPFLHVHHIRSKGKIQVRVNNNKIKYGDTGIEKIKELIFTHVSFVASKKSIPVTLDSFKESFYVKDYLKYLVRYQGLIKKIVFGCRNIGSFEEIHHNQKVCKDLISELKLREMLEELMQLIKEDKMYGDQDYVVQIFIKKEGKAFLHVDRTNVKVDGVDRKDLM